MTTAMQPEERTVAELLGDLAQETGTLVRQEVRLATTEMTDKAKFAAKQGALMASGAMVGVLALLTLLAALVLGIGEFIALWASALIVGIGLAIVAVALSVVGLQEIKRLDVKPKQTVRELQETKTWVQRQVA
jgi:cytochrome c biogenesis protein CcdA